MSYSVGMPQPTDHKLSVLKSLSHPVRLEILRSIIDKPEVSCQQLSPRFDLAQPTMSHHFNKLVKAGVLLNRRQGTLWMYSINEAFVRDLGINLE